MRKIIVAALAASFLTILPMPAQAASFNCRYAKLPDEVAICQSDTLSALDEEMASLFYEVTDMLRRQGRWRALRALKRSQRRWLRRRHACGYNFGCIRRRIVQRIDYFESWL